ncbi:MAG: polymer-forming cytoskeletal protein [Nitrospirae bacterium]|nr:polymer-forming cytoskeletal protein [Nitrospirota bacterium]
MFARKRRSNDAQDIVGFIGNNTICSGELTFQGTFRIDGRLEGKVRSQGTLIVGEEGIVQGEVQIGTLILNGKIFGNVTATTRAALLGQAVLQGDLSTPQVLMEEGIQFNGRCQMATAGGQGRLEKTPGEKALGTPQNLAQGEAPAGAEAPQETARRVSAGR